MPTVPCLNEDATPQLTPRQPDGCIVIPGRPFAKQRPRFSRRSGRAFTPAETISFERTVGTIVARHIPEPLAGPVRVDITAYFAMPASWSQKKRAAMNGQPHTQRPDLDNIQKALLDGMNRIAFADDGQVADLTCRKFWSTSDVTFLIVGAL